MRAVIYARYSSDNQREESIDGQLRDCKNYAKYNDIEIVGEYKEDIDETNCVEKVTKIVKDFKMKNFLYASDFFAVVHIIDTDGVFIKDSSIVENRSLDDLVFTENQLLTPNKNITLERFHKKQKIYNKLLDIEKNW